MAKKNPGDILTGDYNPIIDCVKCSPGCRKCWYLDALFPWLQRLGKIPHDVQANVAHVFENRMTSDYLRPKNGIVGICQHGDLFWDQVSDDAIHRILDVVEETAPMKRKIPKYVLWTKRPERMADLLCARYPQGAPSYLACAVSIENQTLADERLPHLLRINTTRIAVMEPMLGPVDLQAYLEDLHWVIVGSETGGDDARALDLGWVRQLRDQAVVAGLPFFIKQLGKYHGKKSTRELDGRTWDEFPDGFSK